MIPENLKRSIDRYKCVPPTDDQLNPLFDEVNAAKLKGHVLEEVYNYIDKVVHEAEAYQLKTAAEAQARKLEAENRERARRLKEGRLKLQKERRRIRLKKVLIAGGWTIGSMFVGIGLLPSISLPFAYKPIKWFGVFFLIIGVITWLVAKFKAESIELEYGPNGYDSTGYNLVGFVLGFVVCVLLTMTFG